MALTFLQSAVSTANLTTYTFSAQNLGTASADRYIIAEACVRTDTTLDSVSIGGVTATLVIAKTFDAGSEVIALYIAAVPTGTSGDVVVTTSGSTLRCGIALWAATGLSSATASDSKSASAGSEVLNPAPTVNLTVPANGFAIAASMTDNGTAVVSCAWTGLTEKYDQVIESNSLQSGASDTFVSAQSPLAITATWTATLADAGLVAASWAFAAAGPANWKTWNTVTVSSNLKTINTNTLANTKTYDTIS